MKQNSKMPLRNPPVERVTRERMKGGTKSLGEGAGALRKYTVISPFIPPHVSF